MWAALIPAVMAIASYFQNRNSGGSSSGGAAGSQDINALMQQFPEMRQALQLQNSQAQRNDPLQAALSQLGQNLLPRTAFGQLPRQGNIPSWPTSGAFPNPTQVTTGSGMPLAAPGTGNAKLGDRTAPSGNAEERNIRRGRERY